VVGFPCVEVDTARRSHLRPIQALDITNNDQFNGQAFCPVVLQLSAWWVHTFPVKPLPFEDHLST